MWSKKLSDKHSIQATMMFIFFSFALALGLPFVQSIGSGVLTENSVLNLLLRTPGLMTLAKYTGSNASNLFEHKSNSLLENQPLDKNIEELPYRLLATYTDNSIGNRAVIILSHDNKPVTVKAGDNVQGWTIRNIEANHITLVSGEKFLTIQNNKKKNAKNGN